MPVLSLSLMYILFILKKVEFKEESRLTAFYSCGSYKFTVKICSWWIFSGFQCVQE